jgi:hypothetical protein
MKLFSGFLAHFANSLVFFCTLTGYAFAASKPVRDPNPVPTGLTASDWNSIRAVHEAQRHAITPSEAGYRAHNPGQQWQTEFDGRGFLTRPQTGDWQWGLELRSYGFAGHERSVERASSAAKAEGQRVTYEREEGVHEWFMNDERGLEHGFTIQKRPANASDSETPLLFTLAVRGNLHPMISGSEVRFVDNEGAVVVVYANLHVWDAGGKSLPARFLTSNTGIVLSVDERGAHYPITIDPIAQQAYLKASNTAANDFFGAAVAISGNTVVVGAYGEDSAATGVNGNQADNSASSSGAAYVFVRSGSTWTQQAYLKASNTGAGDLFGASVAISGDTVVVGAYAEDSAASGVNGNQASNSATDSGAVYVFVRLGSTWTQQAYLKASNTGASDLFGNSVAISGDTVAVGAHTEDSAATGVNGNQADNSAFASGAAYVFVRSGSTWTQQAYLKASNTGASDLFGSSVAISGDTVVVGAFGEDSAATGVNGSQAGNGATDSGAAYVFSRSGSTWTQQGYLKASNTGVSDTFVIAAISGDTVVVGASGEDSAATGINGNQASNSATDSGAAYVFAGLPATGPLENISTRAEVLTNTNVLIGGFVISGTGTKQVLVRGLGPTLTDFGVAGALADPFLSLVTGSGNVLWNNDNWKDSQQAAIQATGKAPTHDSEAAIVQILGPGNYTAVLSGKNNTTGIGLVEVYDQSPASTAQLSNISSRGHVGTGNNVMIGGFISAVADTRVIVRALGPTLTQFGVTGVLADPVLGLFDGNGNAIASNDNWTQSPQAAQIQASGFAPPNALEPAIISTRPLGNTTAIVSGKNGTTGVALLEVYRLP